MGLRFLHHLHVEVASPDLVLVYGENRIDRLEGRLFPILVPLLDGTRTVEEIAVELAPRPTPLDIAWGIEWLEEHGYLVAEEMSRAVETSPPAAVLRDALGIDPGRFRERAANAAVSVTGFGAAEAGALIASLEAAGIRVDSEGDTCIAVADDALHQDLAAFERQVRERGGRWLLLRPAGLEIWIGPAFDPPRTPCWHCFARRLQERSQVTRARGVRELRAGAIPPPPVLWAPERAAAALQVAMPALVEWVVEGSSERLDGVLTTLHTATLDSRRHRLRRAEGCAVCGDGSTEVEAGALAALPPLELSPRPKRFTLDGGHRTATPDEVLARCDDLVSPLLGVIERLGSYTPNALSQVHAVAAEYTQPLPVGFSSLPAGPVTRSAGKGMSAGQARVGALAEAIERHSGFFRGNEPRRRARFADLPPGEAIAPAELLLIADQQYDRRDEWNEQELPFHWIPERFDPSRAIDWTPAFSLTSNSWRFLPTAYCFYAYPHDDGHTFCRADSNGCAAGSCLEEAILQGLFEVIERDALTLWWYARARRPAVDLGSFGSRYFDDLQEIYRDRRRDVVVLDITTDLGVPTFVAVSRQEGRPGDDVILGAGCHLEARLAIARALTEMNQFLPGFEAGVPRRVLALPATPEDAYLDADPDVEARTLAHYGTAWSDDVTDDVRACVALVRSAGLEVLVVDQTRPDVGLPVVKVVVPGARLFRARFAPGRLFDVPLALGWIRLPLEVDELNDNHIVI